MDLSRPLHSPIFKTRKSSPLNSHPPTSQMPQSSNTPSIPPNHLTPNALSPCGMSLMLSITWAVININSSLVLDTQKVTNPIRSTLCETGSQPSQDPASFNSIPLTT